MAVYINSNFDSGNIEFVSAKSEKDIQLKIRKDTNSDFLQWFYFRISGIRNKDCRIRIINAGETSYPEGWKNYNVVASYDKQSWFRLESEYNKGELSWEFKSDFDSMFFAYFTPFTYEQHLEMIHAAMQSPLCRHRVIGSSVEKRAIDLLEVGEKDPAKKNVWIIARQHPGESMAEWFMQGFIARILDESDALSRKLLEKINFYLIPNMNVDGSIAGNLRSNAAGANLNREWENPSRERSPEVFFTLKEMERIGVDMLLDIHGDEELPYNFIAGNEGNAGYTEAMSVLEKDFKNAWAESYPDFQTKYGYPVDEKGKGNMTVCSNQICHKFNCLALTVELPFKDNADLPDLYAGWSAERSEALGASVLIPILQAVKNF